MKTSKLILSNTSAVISSNISELSFLNEAMDGIVSPLNPSVQFSIPFTIGQSASCAFVVYSNSTSRDFRSSYLSTSGCTKTLVAGQNTVTCICNHLTDFVSIQASIDETKSQDNVNYSPSTTGETQSNVGMIVGVTIAVVSLLAVIGGFVFVRSRRGMRISKYVRHNEIE